jgi:hypothetical protein
LTWLPVIFAAAFNNQAMEEAPSNNMSTQLNELNRLWQLRIDNVQYYDAYREPAENLLIEILKQGKIIVPNNELSVEQLASLSVTGERLAPELASIRLEKNKAVLNRDYESASALRDKEKAIITEIIKDEGQAHFLLPETLPGFLIYRLTYNYGLDDWVLGLRTNKSC